MPGCQGGEVGTRFGGVTDETRRRIEAADAEALLTWVDRLLGAASLDDVLH